MKIDSGKIVFVCGITSATAVNVNSKYDDLETAEQTVYVPPLLSQIANVARTIGGVSNGYYRNNAVVNTGYNLFNHGFNRGLASSYDRFNVGPYNNVYNRRYIGNGYNGKYSAGISTNVFGGDTIINDVGTRIGDQNYGVYNYNDDSSSSNFCDVSSDGLDNESDSDEFSVDAGDVGSEYDDLGSDGEGDQIGEDDGGSVSDYGSAVDSEDIDDEDT